MDQKRAFLFLIFLVFAFSFSSATVLENFFGKITGNVVASGNLCNDSDGGQNYGVLGNTSSEGYSELDSCATSTLLYEGYCDGDVRVSAPFVCPYACFEGVCLEQDQIANSTCTDTDGGFISGILGSVHGKNVANSVYTFSDYCYDRITLNEYACEGSLVSSRTFDCPLSNGGCLNGACVDNTVPSVDIVCTDSDGGLNLFVAGYSTGFMYDGSLWNNVSDSCMFYNTSKNMQIDVSSCTGADCRLKDWHCSNNILYVDYNSVCPNGCLNGACISQANSGENYTPFQIFNLYWNAPSSYAVDSNSYYFADPRLNGSGDYVPQSDDASATQWCKMQDSSFVSGKGGYYMIDNQIDIVVAWNGSAWISMGHPLNYTYYYLCSRGLSNNSSSSSVSTTVPNQEVVVNPQVPVTQQGVASNLSLAVCTAGCSDNNICLPFGYRTSSSYCEVDSKLYNQKTESLSCNNNYECQSNVCVSNKCISSSLIDRILAWFNELFA